MTMIRNWGEPTCVPAVPARFPVIRRSAGMSRYPGTALSIAQPQHQGAQLPQACHIQHQARALLAVTMHIRHIGTDQAGPALRQPHLQVKHPANVPERIRGQTAPEQRMRSRRDQHLTRQRRTNTLQSVAFLVKANMPTLYKQLKKLPWTAIPATSAVSTDHGRRARRTIKAVLVPAWIEFAGAAQVAQVRRTVTKEGKKMVEVVYLITSDRDADPATLAAWVRGHWEMENRLHWVRDVTYQEDKSLVRTGKRAPV